jgi:dipeptidyl aminopeptidase/acylaminoacyl peptidase
MEEACDAGDPDDPRHFLAPIQQAEIIVDKLKAAGVEAKLVVKKGEAHGWPNWHKDMATIADWFDAHLKMKTPASRD